MNEPSKDDRILEELIAMRREQQKNFRVALWVFSGSVILVCLTFGPALSRSAKEFFMTAGAVIAFVLLMGAVFQTIFRGLADRRREKERVAILSGRVNVSRRTS